LRMASAMEEFHRMKFSIVGCINTVVPPQG
jgi:hypothetical protein